MIGRALRRARRGFLALEARAGSARREAQRRALEARLGQRAIRKLNLCSGTQRVPGYFGIDMLDGADLRLDLAAMNLPFADASVDTVVCMSAINYFTRPRARELAREMHRVLRAGGVCRVGVQDMKALAERYVRGDREFFFQKLPDGRERAGSRKCDLDRALPSKLGAMTFERSDQAGVLYTPGCNSCDRLRITSARSMVRCCSRVSSS